MRLANVLIGAAVAVLTCSLVAAGVVKVRQAAEQIKSQCNFKQIAIALHNYHDTCGFLPPGTIGNPCLPPERRMSWYVALLPYVECDNLWSRLNKDLSWDAEQNWPVVSTRHLTYLSDKNPNQQLPDGPGLAHYVGVAGVGIDAPIVDAKDPTAGVVGYDRTIRMADILDGTPNTMFIIDTAAMNGPWAAGGPATVRPLLPSLKPYIGPNRQFGGVHRGVAYIGLCDASVRAVSESVSPATFEALATIAGGDVVGNDF